MHTSFDRGRAHLVAHAVQEWTVPDKFRPVSWPAPFHKPASARTLKYPGPGPRGKPESAVSPEPPSRKTKSPDAEPSSCRRGDGARPRAHARSGENGGGRNFGHRPRFASPISHPSSHCQTSRHHFPLFELCVGDEEASSMMTR